MLHASAGGVDVGSSGLLSVSLERRRVGGCVDLLDLTSSGTGADAIKLHASAGGVVADSDAAVDAFVERRGERFGFV